jgi:lipopolysaccharide biosynthesis protein
MSDTTTQLPIRLIAYYLPQFHPIPENDEWWGRGFTEWTNTAKAKPLFRGHYQPHIPADLGFYDLRLPETRAAQAELARAYGIEAFCYYHYWFGGRRLLERPFNEVLASGEPDFPFCLCWANETWTGVWHGNPKQTLVEQTYPGLDDHRRHFDFLLQAFTDKRYVRVDGRPVFLVYRPTDLPDSRKTTDFWRELAARAGLRGLFLVGMHREASWDPKPHGFDAVVATRLPYMRRRWVSWEEPVAKIRSKILSMRGIPTIHDYASVMNSLIADPVPGIESFPAVINNWDNTPRSGANGIVLHGATPALFRQLVRRAFEQMRDVPREHRLVFLKSWNEWAEGNHLEPDLRDGHGYLEVLRDELLTFGASDVSRVTASAAAAA